MQRSLFIIFFVVANILLSSTESRAADPVIESFTLCGSVYHVKVSGGTPPYRVYGQGSGCTGSQITSSSSTEFTFSATAAVNSMSGCAQPTIYAFTVADSDPTNNDDAINAPSQQRTPSKPIVNGNTNLCQLPIELTVSYQGGVSYQWLNSNQNPIAGATGSTYSPSVSSPTSFYVEASNACGSNMSDEILIEENIPSPPVIEDQIGCSIGNNGMSGTITASGGFDSYIWYEGLDEVTGVTGPTLNYTISRGSGIGVKGIVGTCETDKSTAAIYYVGLNGATTYNGKMNVSYAVDQNFTVQRLDIEIRDPNGSLIYDELLIYGVSEEWPTGQNPVNFEVNVGLTGDYEISIDALSTYSDLICSQTETSTVGNSNLPPPDPLVVGRNCGIIGSDDAIYYFDFVDGLAGDTYSLFVRTDDGMGTVQETSVANSLTGGRFTITHSELVAAGIDMYYFDNFRAETVRDALSSSRVTISMLNITPEKPTFTGESNLCYGTVSLTAQAGAGDLHTGSFEWTEAGSPTNVIVGNVLNWSEEADFELRAINTDETCKSEPEFVAIALVPPSPPIIEDQIGCSIGNNGMSGVITASGVYDSFIWYEGPDEVTDVTGSTLNYTISRGSNIGVRGVIGICESEMSEADIYYVGLNGATTYNGKMTVSYAVDQNFAVQRLDIEIRDPNGSLIYDELLIYEQSEEWPTDQTQVNIQVNVGLTGDYDILVIAKDEYDTQICTQSATSTVNSSNLPPPDPLVLGRNCGAIGSEDAIFNFDFSGGPTGDTYTLFVRTDDGNGTVQETEVVSDIATTSLEITHQDLINTGVDMYYFDAFVAETVRNELTSNRVEVTMVDITPPLPEVSGNMEICMDVIDILVQYSSSNINATIEWEYPDGSRHTGQLPDVDMGGIYKVWLVENDFGCVGPVLDVDITKTTPPDPVLEAEQLYCNWQYIQITSALPPDGGTYKVYNQSGSVFQESANIVIDPIRTPQILNLEVETVNANERCVSESRSPVTLTITDDCDDNLNWVEATTYNEKGEKISRGKNYFDLTGRPLQSQNVVFANDGGQDVVFATQTLSDALDREVLATLPAPITYFDRNTTEQPADGEIDFRYDGYFLLDGQGEIYNYTNFDPALRVTPDAVGEAQSGTLGWYYSDNNTLEPYTPATDFPYTRKEYYDDGTGEPKRVAGPGDIYHLDSDRKTLAGVFGVTGELTEYSALHQTVFDEATAIDLSQEAIISISIDANGQSVISVADKGEKVLMTAEGIDPGEVTDDSKEFTCFGSTDINNGVTVLYFYLLKDQTVTWGGTGMFTLTNIITNEEINPILPTLSRGFYKISLTGTEDRTIEYTNRFATISYSFYDDAGRLVSSVSPNGVITWRAAPDASKASVYEEIDKTTYKYNHQGWLLSMTEPDAGTTNYMYRKDGSVRFSQNAEQNTQGKFSYTHYDRSGRPVESGEYFSGSRSFGDSQLKLWLEDTYDDFAEREWERGINVQDWVFTYYDLPDTYGPDGLWSKVGLNVATATDKDKEAFTQTFLMGAVSYTENANMKTWYSYDHRGRVDWMVQAPKAINESNLNRVFKIDYTYDFLGNVDTVAYKAYVPDDGTMEPVEQFYHHYEYDNNQRLIEVQAGDNPDELSVQAKYYYYLHGPLKRVELGGDKQGIDYVYTIQGWLKSINHPEGNRDPGLDGISGDHASFEKDLFAMTLEYFNGDYTRSGTNIESINAGQEYFNGNIRNITWRTGAEEHGAEPVMYTYAYDDKYQLTGAEFGTPDFTNNTLLASLGDQYRVNNLIYDANGNIKGLHRYNGLQLVEEEGEMVERATSLHDFTGAYQYDIANTNKLTSITGYSTYQYNSIGQLTRETPEEGDIRKMIYDVTGKVTAVTDDDDNDKVSFTYDDRGFRLMKKKDGEGPDDPDIETWYIRDASGNVLTTYEKRGAADAELTETMIYGSGRIGMYRHDYLKTDPDVDYITGAEVRNEYEGRDYELLPDGSLTLTEGFTFEASGTETLHVSTITGDEVIGASQYELTDHLGNVRIGVMEGDGNAVTFDASMEADKAAEEEQYFFNMSSRYMDPLRNHTATGSYSSLLNPNNLDEPQHSYSIGPAINLEVSPGDTVRMKVYAQYNEDISDPNNVVPALVSAIAGGFGYISPVGEGTALVDAFSTAFGAGAAIPNADRQGAPKAYIQYIIFNKNMTTAQHGHVMVDPNEKGTWQKMELEVPIEEIGYIYIYVANESMDDVDVYFDDMEVQLIDAPVTNASDYYPFGLAMAGRSYTSEKYRFGYQGQFAELDEETGWNSFELRMYAPVIGRWMATDPYGQFFSPYTGMGNNPIIGIDKDGGVLDDITINESNQVVSIKGTTDNYDRVLDESGAELFRTPDGVKFNFDIFNYINISKGTNYPNLAGIGIGTMGVTIDQLSKNYILGVGGKFYPKDFKGRGWNFISKSGSLKNSAKILSKVGLIVDGILLIPTARDAIKSGSFNSAESGQLYKSVSIMYLAYEVPALGAFVAYMDWYATTPQGQQAIHKGLEIRRQRELEKRGGFKMPKGPTYFKPDYNWNR